MMGYYLNYVSGFGVLASGLVVLGALYASFRAQDPEAWMSCLAVFAVAFTVHTFFCLCCMLARREIRDNQQSSPS